MKADRDAILAIVARETRLDPAKLEPSATLMSLGVASLDVVSVLFAIEDELGVEIPVEDMAGAETLGQFVDIIQARVAAA